MQRLGSLSSCDWQYCAAVQVGAGQDNDLRALAPMVIWARQGTCILDGLQVHCTGTCEPCVVSLERQPM